MWANGNGGIKDDCGADGYSSSIYTISVGAVGVTGEPSHFDEECSAKMVTAYVTDDEGFSAVVSSVLRNTMTIPRALLLWMFVHHVVTLYNCVL